MRAVFLTAGAAGMYCGSCMHDNALARAMRQSGVDCVLQPVYTPIRTDSESLAGEQVFFGGIHIYLLQQMPWLRHVPRSLRRALDWAPLIRLATRRSHATDATKLGQLTISMLKGSQGNQSEEVARLVAWLRDQMQPDAVVFSNLLIGGVLPTLRQSLPSTRLVVVLQGDDIFLDFLPEPERSQAIQICRSLVSSVDRFVVNSQFYASKMGDLFQIPAEKIVVSPLSIDTQPFAAESTELVKRDDGQFRIGYLARIAPEKGLHRLVDAFMELASDSKHDDLSLHIAGWLGDSHQNYFSELRRKVERARLSDRMTYHGSPSLDEKITFLRGLDLLSVPTDYEEPKGLFVLESLAAGVPVVQPNHGAFGELIESTGGGLVVEPNNVPALCRAIEELKSDPARRKSIGEAGRLQVSSKHSIEVAAAHLKQILFD